MAGARTLSLSRALVVGVLAVAGSLAAAPTGLGATSETKYDVVRVGAPEPQDEGRFGERSAPTNDIDGDGVADIFVSAFQQDVGGASKSGRVYLLSGRDRSVIYGINSPDPQANERFGFFMSAPGDLDGDGKGDIVVGSDLRDVFRGESQPGVPNTAPCGAPEPNGCYENEGAAYAYSGTTGRLLYALVNPQPQSNTDSAFGGVFGFGVGLGSAGDINGDGRADILVGAASNDVPRDCNTTGARPCRVDQGQAFVFDGATGGLLRTYDVPDPDLQSEACNTPERGGPGATTCGFLGFALQGVGDVDGDGVVDHLIDAGTYDGRRPTGVGEGVRRGRMYLFSGRLGTPIRSYDSPISDTRIFGLQDVAPFAPGDVNGDGVPDIYGNSFQEVGAFGSQGRGFVFDGATGALLYTLDDPTPRPGGNFGYSVATTDYDQDGKDDLFVGQNGSEVTLGGGSYIFAGPTGALLKPFELPADDRDEQKVLPPPGPRFGRTVSAPGDLNQDGQPDYVVGAPQIDVGSNKNQGRVYFFLSNVPKPQPQLVPPFLGVVQPKDVTAPLLALGGRLAQRIKRGHVYVRVRADEDVALTAKGSVARPSVRSRRAVAKAKSKARKARRAQAIAAQGKSKARPPRARAAACICYRLVPTKAGAKARQKVTLKLRLTKKTIKAVKRALRAGRRSTARVKVMATDTAGNKTLEKRQIRIKK